MVIQCITLYLVNSPTVPPEFPVAGITAPRIVANSPPVLTPGSRLSSEALGALEERILSVAAGLKLCTAVEL